MTGRVLDLHVAVIRDTDRISRLGVALPDASPQLSKAKYLTLGPLLPMANIQDSQHVNIIPQSVLKPTDMSVMPRLDTAVAAASVVGMADQVMEGIRDNNNHRPDDAHAHYVKAAIAGAIAIGAYEMLKRDEAQGKKQSHGGINTQPCDDANHGHHTHHHGHSHQHDGHSNDIIAETLGAYALGRQMMGHSDHHILKMVAEGLGVAGLAREVDRELVKH